MRWIACTSAAKHRSTQAGDLDTAASWLELADKVMPAAPLRVTDADRIDAHATRHLLS